jgi:hypothetical protein
MSFVSPDSMVTEDFTTSSISISVSSASGDIGSYSDDLCQEPVINCAFLDEKPVKKRKIQHMMHTATSWI